MKLLQISEPCPICGEGVASLQQDTGYDGNLLYYRECNFCTSDYAGSYELDLNRAIRSVSTVVQSELSFETLKQKGEL